MKRLIRNSIGYLTFFTGVSAFIRDRWPRPGTLILMFHRVRDDNEAYFGGIGIKQFERLIRYLRKHYRTFSLSALVEHIRQERPVPHNSVVLTFDDGFRDNYDNAFPLLRDHGIPATVFLVTNSIETGELPWPQRIGFILQHTTQTEASIGTPVHQTFQLRTNAQRLEALEQIKNLRRSLTLEELEAIADRLSDCCGVVPPQDRMLTWDQIGEMSRHGIEFGAHTVTHPLMEYLPLESAKNQLVGSKEIIEERLGRQVRHFCFPAGNLNDQLVEVAKQVGFESLFRPGEGQHVNTHLSDPHALRRCGAYDPAPVMAAELAGILEILRFRRRPRIRIRQTLPNAVYVQINIARGHAQAGRSQKVQ